MSDEYSVGTNFQAGRITADDYRYKMERVRAREADMEALVEATLSETDGEPSEAVQRGQ